MDPEKKLDWLTIMAGEHKIIFGTVPSPFNGTRRPELMRLHDPGSAQHLVQFYEDDSLIIENLAFLVSKTLAAGDSSVVIATPDHLARIGQRLEVSCANLNQARTQARLVELDAADALDRFTSDGSVDEEKFERVIGETVRDAASKSPRSFVFAFGEMVELLWEDGRPDQALRLEQLWNSLATRHHFSLYCTYSLGSLRSSLDPDILTQICAEHALAITTEE